MTRGVQVCSQAEQDEILSAIAAHLAEHGPTNWGLVRDRWPDIIGGKGGSNTERRFYRWVKKVQGGEATPAEAKETAIRKARGATKKNLPAVPSPQAFLAAGARADRNVDLMAMLYETFSDVKLIRDAAVIVNDDGTQKVKNFVQLDAMIKRRLDLTQTYISIFQEIYDLQRMREFYGEIQDIIVSEIHPLAPEVAARIIARLQALNDRESMTMHASARPPAAS